MSNYLEEIGVRLYPCFGTVGRNNNVFRCLRYIHLSQILILIDLSIDVRTKCQNEKDSYTQKYLRGEFNKYIY